MILILDAKIKQLDIVQYNAVVSVRSINVTGLHLQWNTCTDLFVCFDLYNRQANEIPLVSHTSNPVCFVQAESSIIEKVSTVDVIIHSMQIKYVVLENIYYMLLLSQKLDPLKT